MFPVLEEFKIKSFFFVYTSIFEGKPDNLEIFRYFRTNYFNSIEEFYKDFYKFLDKDLQSFFEKKTNEIKNLKIRFPFYSIEDIKFRLVRNNFLTKNQYEKTMFTMFKEKKFKNKEFFKILFFQKKDLQTLNNLGHLVGLHSHNHPTLLEKLSHDEQKNEYEKNLYLISQVLGKPQNEIKFMSHPCGSYNKDTLKILKELGIELGFRQEMGIEPKKGVEKINNSFLEIARQNHTSILKRINQ